MPKLQQKNQVTHNRKKLSQNSLVRRIRIKKLRKPNVFIDFSSVDSLESLSLFPLLSYVTINYPRSSVTRKSVNEGRGNNGLTTMFCATVPVTVAVHPVLQAPVGTFQSAPVQSANYQTLPNDQLWNVRRRPKL